MKIGIKAGESLSFGIKLPDAYDVSDLVDLTLKIGNSIFWRYGIELEATADVRIFRAALNSQQTARMNGRYAVEIGLADVGFGRKVELVASLEVERSNGFGLNAVNGGINYMFELTEVSADVITIETQLMAALRGYSAYDIAVQEGFTGTQAEWLASITASSLIVTVAVAGKGNGDIITHGLGANLRIITFYDDADSGRQRNDFFANGQTLTQFTLNNDFTNDKYTGTLLCVKY